MTVVCRTVSHTLSILAATGTSFMSERLHQCLLGVFLVTAGFGFSGAHRCFPNQAVNPHDSSIAIIYYIAIYNGLTVVRVICENKHNCKISR